MSYILSDLKVDGHEAIDYRPDWEDRHTPPADICKKCSDIPAGRLVPVSLCTVLGPAVKREYEEFLNGTWRENHG